MHNMEKKKLTQSRVLGLFDEAIKKVETLLEKADKSELFFEDTEYLDTYYEVEQIISEVFPKGELEEFRKRLDFSHSNSKTKKGSVPQQFRPIDYAINPELNPSNQGIRSVYRRLYETHLRHLASVLKSYKKRVENFYEDPPSPAVGTTL